MKNEKKNVSLVSVYSFLSVLTGMAGFITIVAIIVPIISFSTDSELPFWYGINVDLEINKTELIVNKSQNNFITNLKGDLFMIDSPTFSKIVASAIPLIMFGAITFGLLSLRKLFKNIYDNNYFVRENIKIMYQLSIVCIVTPVLVGMLKRIMIEPLYAEFVYEGLQIKNDGIFNIVVDSLFSVYLILGFIFALFANIFKEGEKMKEEIDLTV